MRLVRVSRWVSLRNIQAASTSPPKAAGATVTMSAPIRASLYLDWGFTGERSGWVFECLYW
jgi:hypothetical protein